MSQGAPGSPPNPWCLSEAGEIGGVPSQRVFVLSGSWPRRKTGLVFNPFHDPPDSCSFVHSQRQSHSPQLSNLNKQSLNQTSSPGDRRKDSYCLSSWGPQSHHKVVRLFRALQVQLQTICSCQLVFGLPWSLCLAPTLPHSHCIYATAPLGFSFHLPSILSLGEQSHSTTPISSHFSEAVSLRGLFPLLLCRWALHRSQASQIFAPWNLNIEQKTQGLRSVRTRA